MSRFSALRPAAIAVVLVAAALLVAEFVLPHHLHAPGTVTEVVYAGPVTRYVVRLDAAGQGTNLIALQQNGSAAVAEAFERGTAVDLLWRPEHVVTVPARTAP